MQEKILDKKTKHIFDEIKKTKEDIKLADLKDIACMKIDAISSRGSKKDFIEKK